MKKLQHILMTYKYMAAFIILLFLSGSFSVSLATASTIIHKTIITADTPLGAFEGIYQLKENEFINYQITLVNNKLIAKMVGSKQELVMTRKSDLSFEVPDDDGDETLTVTFSKNNAGEISQALLSGKQLLIKVKSIPPIVEVKLNAQQLKAFEGKYEFEGKKGIFIQITATATGLMLKQLWDKQEINFIALSDLTFLNRESGFPLKFTKDQNGNVIKVLAFNRDSWSKVMQ
jgi:hypothetical protein